MVKISLRLTTGSTDWWYVTAGMAPDDISYAIQYDGSEYTSSDSLNVLLSLYGCVSNQIPSKQYPGPTWFEVIETEGGIEIQRWNLELPIDTTYGQCRGALEPFLAEIFQKLDQTSAVDRREEALEFAADYTGLMDAGIDIWNLHERLVNEHG